MVLAALSELAVATVGVPIGMIGYWLLQHSQAATSPVAPSLPSLVDAALNSVGYGLFGAAAALAVRSADCLSGCPLSEPLDCAHRTRRLSRAGRPRDRRRAGAHIADRPVDRTPLSEPGAYGPCLCDPISAARSRQCPDDAGQIPRGLEEVGALARPKRLSVARRVVAPLAANGLGAGAALVFIFVSTNSPRPCSSLPSGHGRSRLRSGPTRRRWRSRRRRRSRR